MQVNELSRQVKEQVENIEAAEQTGNEALVIAQLIKLRKLLNGHPALEALCL